MSADVSSLDGDYSLLEFVKDVGIDLPAKWEGREVAWEGLPDFADAIEPRVLSLFQSLVADPKAFNQLAISLARVGSKDHTLLERDISQMLVTPEGVFLGGVGFFKSVGKFWSHHKKEILIGAAVVVVAVGVTAIIVCTAGTAGAVAGAAGGAAIKGLSDNLSKKEDPPIPKGVDQPHFAAKPSQGISLAPSTPIVFGAPLFSQQDFLSSMPKELPYPSPFMTPIPGGFSQRPPIKDSGYMMPDPPPDRFDATEAYYQNLGVQRRKEEEIEWKRSHTDNYAASVYYDRPTNKISTPPPFREVPLLGEPDQSTIHFHCGINNTLPTAFEGGATLRGTLDQGFAVQSHLIHSDNIAGGLAFVALEKLDHTLRANPVVAGLAGLLLLPIPGALLQNSDVQRSIDYEVATLSKIAQNIIEKGNPNLKQVHVAFSNGGHVFKEALEMLSPEYRDTIIVITAGTTAIIDDHLACKVYNVIGDKDLASQTALGGLNSIEKAKSGAQVEMILQGETKSIVGGHYFLQPEYQKKIAGILKKEIVGAYEIY